MLKEIDVLGVELQTFGIFFALNFLCWAAVVARRLKELGKPVDWAYEMLFAALIGGLVGARALLPAAELRRRQGRPARQPLLAARASSGTAACSAASIAVLLWAWWRDFLRLALLDMAAPALALGYAIGRIGCQISGDGDYGKASDLPWAMGYPDGAVPTAPGVEVQPTPIYETLCDGAARARAVAPARRASGPGALFGIYLVGAGVERFLVEFARRNEHVLGGADGGAAGEHHARRRRRRRGCSCCGADTARCAPRARRRPPRPLARGPRPLEAGHNHAADGRDPGTAEARARAPAREPHRRARPPRGRRLRRASSSRASSARPRTSYAEDDLRARARAFVEAMRAAARGLRRPVRLQGVPLHRGLPRCSRRRGSPATSPPAASSRSRCAAASTRRASTCTATRSRSTELREALDAGVGHVVLDSFDDDRPARARSPASGARARRC